MIRLPTKPKPSTGEGKEFVSVCYLQDAEEKFTPWFHHDTEVVDYLDGKGATIKYQLRKKDGQVTIKDLYGERLPEQVDTSALSVSVDYESWEDQIAS